MPIKKTIQREMEVAFSRQVQPVWFRILKYVLIAGLIYFFRRSKSFWIIFISFIFLSLLLHFWYRYKTKGWTKSYGLWKFDRHGSKKPEN